MEEILKYFPGLDATQLKQLSDLGVLYPEWNQRINVISRKDIDNLYLHHVLHSLAIAKLFEPREGTSLLDFGTGGGFPGIPLAIIWPQCSFHLIDRIGKKIRVAREIAQAIGLTNVTFQHGDIGECRTRFDFVVTRAVMRFDTMLPLIRKNITPGGFNALPNGVIALKGGNLDDETRLGRGATVEEFAISDWFSEEYFKTKKIIYMPMA